MFDIITIGTATRDVFLPLKDEIKSVDDPEHLKALGFEEGRAKCFPVGAKIDIELPVFSIGGGATNTAVTFARQGFKTGALVTIGNDANGRLVLTDLKKEKIKAIPVISKEHGTGYSTLLLTEDGERTVVVYRGAANDLTTDKIKLKSLRAKWAYIVPGAIEFETISEIIAALRKRNIKVAMNPSKHYLEFGAEKLRPLLNQCNVVSVNRSEAAQITKTAYEDERAIFKVLDDLIDGIAVMSEGPAGALVSDGRTIIRTGIFKEKRVADRTGAGDAFGSGFIAGLLRSGNKKEYSAEDLREAIRLASANATAVVENVGAQTGILSKKEFESEERWQELKIESI